MKLNDLEKYPTCSSNGNNLVRHMESSKNSVRSQKNSYSSIEHVESLVEQNLVGRSSSSMEHVNNLHNFLGSVNVSNLEEDELVSHRLKIAKRVFATRN